MARIDDTMLERLNARLDAQEKELVGLRAEMARIVAPAIAPAPVAGRTVTAAESVITPSPSRKMTASRRTLLKGAGAALFTTALLATGEVVPITPFSVAAADPPPRPSGPTAAIATTPDTLYQTFIGTDFHPETTNKGEVSEFSSSSPTALGRSSRRWRAPRTSAPDCTCRRGRRSPRSSSTSSTAMARQCLWISAHSMPRIWASPNSAVRM